MWSSCPPAHIYTHVYIEQSQCISYCSSCILSSHFISFSRLNSQYWRRRFPECRGGPFLQRFDWTGPGGGRRVHCVFSPEPKQTTLLSSRSKAQLSMMLPHQDITCWHSHWPGPRLLCFVRQKCLTQSPERACEKWWCLMRVIWEKPLHAVLLKQHIYI